MGKGCSDVDEDMTLGERIVKLIIKWFLICSSDYVYQLCTIFLFFSLALLVRMISVFVQFGGTVMETEISIIYRRETLS